MKYQHFILAALFLSGITGCHSSSKSEETKEHAPVTTVVEDSTAKESATPAEEAVSEQEIQAQKTFLETFYSGLDESFEPDYVKQFITPNARQILSDGYEFDCDGGDCLAIWLFTYEGGGDTGPCLSRTIKPQGTNKFLVTHQYEGEEYNVLLTLIKEGDTYKIDNIEKQ